MLSLNASVQPWNYWQLVLLYLINDPLFCGNLPEQRQEERRDWKMPDFYTLRKLLIVLDTSSIDGMLGMYSYIFTVKKSISKNKEIGQNCLLSPAVG